MECGVWCGGGGRSARRRRRRRVPRCGWPPCRRGRRWGLGAARARTRARTRVLCDDDRHVELVYLGEHRPFEVLVVAGAELEVVVLGQEASAHPLRLFVPLDGEPCVPVPVHAPARGRSVKSVGGGLFFFGRPRASGVPVGRGARGACAGRRVFAPAGICRTGMDGRLGGQAGGQGSGMPHPCGRVRAGAPGAWQPVLICRQRSCSLLYLACQRCQAVAAPRAGGRDGPQNSRSDRPLLPLRPPGCPGNGPATRCRLAAYRRRLPCPAADRPACHGGRPSPSRRTPPPPLPRRRRRSGRPDLRAPCFYTRLLAWRQLQPQIRAHAERMDVDGVAPRGGCCGGTGGAR